MNYSVSLCVVYGFLHEVVILVRQYLFQPGPLGCWSLAQLSQINHTDSRLEDDLKAPLNHCNSPWTVGGL